MKEEEVNKIMDNITDDESMCIIRDALLNQREEPLKLWNISIYSSIPENSENRLFNLKEDAKKVFEECIDGYIRDFKNEILSQLVDNKTYCEIFSREQNLEMFKLNSIENNACCINDFNDVTWELSLFLIEVE